MKVKPTVRFEDIEKEILVKSPKKREISISKESSGWIGVQTFRSEDLPDEILYKFIGLVKFPNGNIYPKYIANCVTKRYFYMKRLQGIENGIYAINKIAWWLTYQEGMIFTGSVKHSDLKHFDYKSENLSYWLASLGINKNTNFTELKPEAVTRDSRGKGEAKLLFVSEFWSAYGLPIRPIIVLNSKVEIETVDTNLIKL